MEKEEILKKIDNAEMILVGLGEDFDENIRLQKSDVYKEGMKMLKEADCFHRSLGNMLLLLKPFCRILQSEQKAVMSTGKYIR